MTFTDQPSEHSTETQVRDTAASTWPRVSYGVLGGLRVEALEK